MHRLSLSHKNCKHRNKIEAAILKFDDVVIFTCTFIAHFTFQMRKVLVTRNSSQTTRRCSPPGRHGRLGTRPHATTASDCESVDLSDLSSLAEQWFVKLFFLSYTVHQVNYQMYVL